MAGVGSNYKCGFASAVAVNSGKKIVRTIRVVDSVCTREGTEKCSADKEISRRDLYRWSWSASP